ncbi:cytochrome o ubiquinol oxidase subunit IV [Kozakia baliensis]|uniref:cytochrome o ubiquinol oxidase subunit IV n=1 Tax=Kozakia baliensis TaxID=153496 RepID=UPI00087B4194|nr:cytochrome o ubiquinol oxidase subunit IV [Kozakia baliensis]AOX21692.1 cytochrome-c oxidase [Kozakia baliensis]
MTRESTQARHQYITGFALALFLSAIPFGLLSTGTISRSTLLWTIGLSAIVQVCVHFYYFLHIDLKRSHRDDLQLILFTVLIIFLMAGGTLWIIGNQHSMMM